MHNTILRRVISKGKNDKPWTMINLLHKHKQLQEGWTAFDMNILMTRSKFDLFVTQVKLFFQKIPLSWLYDVIDLLFQTYFLKLGKSSNELLLTIIWYKQNETFVQKC